MSQRTIRDMISLKTTDPSPTTNTNTPNTRKRTRNYAILHEYRLDGSPKPTQASLTLSTRKRAPLKASKHPTIQQAS